MTSSGRWEVTLHGPALLALSPSDKARAWISERIMPVGDGDPTQDEGNRQALIDSEAALRALRDQASAFEGIAAYDDESITASTSGEPQRIEGGRVSANFFSVLRVQPILGRAFTPDEDRSAGPPLVILSHHYWESHFNSDPKVVDRTLRIDAIAHSIIGVVPVLSVFIYRSHFLMVTVVPLPTWETMSNSSINHLAPGSPTPSPRRVE